MSDNHTTAEGQPDNVFDLAKEICDRGEDRSTPGELETRRKVFIRVNQIVLSRLDADALKLEQQAIVGEGSIQRRHQLMDLARCLRTTMTWIGGPPTEPQPEAEL